jgi:hypothetical protein
VETKNQDVASAENQEAPRRYLPALLLLGAYLLLATRLFVLISRDAVNILFWDPWDLDDATLFQQHSVWQMFRWQHGWHRQGLGALMQKVVEPYIHWNGRSEAFLLGALFVVVSVLALLLKVRLYRGVCYSDLVVPLLFLSPLQYETLVWSPNPSQGALPLLLAILYSFCWLIRTYHWKYTCILIVNFFLIYSGFGIFIGPVTPVLLALDYYANTRHLPTRYQWGTAAALAISIASFASFFIGYRFTMGVDCPAPAPKNPLAYPPFITLMFAHAGGFRALSLPLASLVGSVALLLFLAGLTITTKRLFTRASDQWPRDAVIAALLAYSGIFCLNASYARMCLGLAAAYTSRYTPYVILGLFGVYLYALSNRRPAVRVKFILVLAVFAVSGACPLNRSDAFNNDLFNRGKRAWRECYLARHNIYECNAVTHFQIHPHPEATHLQDKLDFLERNHLNLYDNSQ